MPDRGCLNRSCCAAGLSYAYQPSVQGNSIAAIFQCPTDNEQNFCRPVCGVTGQNFRTLMNFVRNRKKGKSYYAYSSDMMAVINATEEVFKSKAPEKQIRESINKEENIDRIRALLKGVSTVFCFGRLAYEAYCNAKKDSCDVKPNKVVATYHLSPVALSRIVKLNDGRLIDECEELIPNRQRLKIIADYLSIKLNDKVREHGYNEFVEFIKNYTRIKKHNRRG